MQCPHKEEGARGEHVRGGMTYTVPGYTIGGLSMSSESISNFAFRVPIKLDEPHQFI